MSGLRAVLAVLANGRQGEDAFAHVWLVVWTAVLGGAGVFLALMMFISMEPGK